MKYISPLIAVNDMDKSVEFYKRVLGLRVVTDYGANKSLTGGLSLQTLDTWAGFLNKKEDNVNFGGNNFELYFEEDDMDGFIEKLKTFSDIKFVNELNATSWGQRVLRFYDPDKNIIEVGENMKAVTKRFFDSGMTKEEVAKRMNIDVKYVNAMLR